MWGKADVHAGRWAADGEHGYTYEGVAFYIYKYPRAGLKPIHVFINPKNGNKIFSMSPSQAGPHSDNFKRQGVIGYGGCTPSKNDGMNIGAPGGGAGAFGGGEMSACQPACLRACLPACLPACRARADVVGAALYLRVGGLGAALYQARVPLLSSPPLADVSIRGGRAAARRRAAAAVGQSYQDAGRRVSTPHAAMRCICARCCRSLFARGSCQACLIVRTRAAAIHSLLSPWTFFAALE